MFSGIVEERATVVSFQSRAEHGTLVIRSGLDLSDTRVGASIAIDGVCLTVTVRNGQELHFDAGSETLRRSTLGKLRPNARVNLERALKMGDRIDGHLVSGHIDATTQLLACSEQAETIRLEWRLPSGLEKYIAPKGSVSLAGISLTVGEVSPDSFGVYVIPHTLSMTTLGEARTGWEANLEVDMLSRYVVQALKTGSSESADWMTLLQRSGFTGTSI